jgi:hypothetical protein
MGIFDLTSASISILSVVLSIISTYFTHRNSNKKVWKILVSLMIGSIISISLILLVLYWDSISVVVIDIISKPYFVVIIPFLGLLLYWFRCVLPIPYGITELIIGIITAVQAFLLIQNGLINETKPSLEIMLKLAAGLYIIVRGMDNISKGLGHIKGIEYNFFGIFWFTLFPDKKQIKKQEDK